MPDRQILIAAFIFSAKHKDTTSVQSISLVMNDSSWRWYQQYERLVEDWLNQIIQRVKAALFVVISVLGLPTWIRKKGFFSGQF